MKVCTKCHEEKPDAEFVWDDGLLLGFGTRCKECRARKRNCPDCVALWGGKHYSRKSRAPRCESCGGLRRPPGVPAPRFLIRRHAVARFAERMRPDIERYGDALHEMFRLMEDAEHSEEPQHWYREAPYDGFVTFRRGYLHVADGAMFSLSDYGDGKGVQVSTVLTGPEFVMPDALDPAPGWVAEIHEIRKRQYARRAQYREDVRAKYGSRHGDSQKHAS